MHAAKKIAQKLAPNTFAALHNLKVRHRLSSTSRLLRSVIPADDRLGLTELKTLNTAYPPMGDEYPETRDSGYYHPRTVAARAAERAAQIIDWMPLERGEVLEVGCGDATVGAALQSHQVGYTGIDLSDTEFNLYATVTEAGVRLIKMNAHNMDFEDETFDLVFSYDSFEHFEEPSKSFEEIIRVTKPGGHILLSFGPLFMSPWGLHVGYSIGVPYCQFLFNQETLMTFVDNEKLRPIGYYCNGWRVSQYRSLFTDQRVHCLSYNESKDLSHIPLIKKYAPIFRNHADNVEDLLEDLITDHITAVFKRKRQNPL